MVAMTPDGKWCSVEEAVGIAGCTDGLIRLRLREGRLEGWKANERAWMVSVEGCRALRSELGPLSNVHKPAKPKQTDQPAEAQAAKRKRKSKKSR